MYCKYVPSMLSNPCLFIQTTLSVWKIKARCNSLICFAYAGQNFSPSVCISHWGAHVSSHLSGWEVALLASMLCQNWGENLILGRNYWRDYDTALFMLRHLYRDVAEEPEELEGSSRSSLKGWCKPREILDEELPLTFADNVFIKHFSYQVKKMSKKQWMVTPRLSGSTLTYIYASSLSRLQLIAFRFY